MRWEEETNCLAEIRVVIMRIFQAFFLIFIVLGYGLLALAMLWWLARDLFSLISQEDKAKAQVKTRHWRSGYRRKFARQAPVSSSATNVLERRGLYRRV